MEMEENAELHQDFEESGSLSQTELLEIICNALKKATGGDPDRLTTLLEKLEQIVKLNTERPQDSPPAGNGESSQEQRHQSTG
jgi:hypothetical protein